MSAVNAAPWLGLVFGIGGMYCFGCLGNYVEVKSYFWGKSIAYLGAIWFFGPILYAVPYLIDSIGFIAFVAWMWTWPAGVEYLVRDLLGVSISEFLGLID